MVDQSSVEAILKQKDHFHKARLIQTLRDENKLTIKELSQHLQMKPAYVCHYLRLLKLPSIVIDGYYSNMVSATHLYILARLKTEQDMIQAYEEVLAKNLTSQQTEEMVREKLYGIATSTERLSKDEIKDYTRQIEELYRGIELKVVQTRIKGKIICEVKGDTAKSTKLLKEIMDKLVSDNSGVKRVSRNVFILE